LIQGTTLSPTYFIVRPMATVFTICPVLPYLRHGILLKIN